MKIRFKATEHHKSHYLVAEGMWFFDGDVVDVDDELAKKLLKEYPKNFESMAEVKEQMRGAKKQKEVKDSKHKMVEGGKTKEG